MTRFDLALCIVEVALDDSTTACGFVDTMRVCAITAVLHAVLTTGSPVDDMILSALAPQIPTTHAPSPRSTQDTVQPTPAAILAQVHDSLE